MIIQDFTCTKRAIRILTIYKYNAHTEPLCKALNIIKLPDVYNLQLYKLYYKIQQEPVPHYFNTNTFTLLQYQIRHTPKYTTMHTFANQNCLHAMTALINKHPIIRLKTTTIQP